MTLGLAAPAAAGPTTVNVDVAEVTLLAFTEAPALACDPATLKVVFGIAKLSLGRFFKAAKFVVSTRAALATRFVEM